ncbi:MAG: hypothetical protein Q8Q73_04610 [Stagnimonas sp.]|nr:hypothetical protein [Stagnimonas sp.]
MDKGKLESVRDNAANGALQARGVIEAAVDQGELPRWVLEICEAWERSSLAYGAASAQLRQAPPRLTLEASPHLH